MTVEEKNVVIEGYMGEFPIICKDLSGNPFPKTDIDYMDWGKLMPVWSKLRGELVARGSDTATIHKDNIQRSIAVLVDIATAHSLIHSAIELLNKNKV